MRFGLLLLLVTGTVTAGSANSVWFSPNMGQAPASVQWLAQTPGAGLAAYFAGDRVVLRTSAGTVGLRFPNANPAVRLEGSGPLAARVTVLGRIAGGRPPAGPAYASLAYRGLYGGVDLVFGTDARGQLKTEFVLTPGADPSRIRFRYEGADRIRVADDGSLVVDLPAGRLTDHAPTVYQDIGGRRAIVSSAFRLWPTGAVGFALGPYDRKYPLIIDPILSFSVYFGGAQFEAATAVAVDPAGNAYMAGWTESVDLPPGPAWQPPRRGGVDAFLAKFDPAGVLVYYAVIGGSGYDAAFALAVDSSGSAVVAGSTTSTDFPSTPGSAQRTGGGGMDAFVARFDPSGTNLVYATYLGGSGADAANALALDPAGNAYIGGQTNSVNFPTLHGVQAVSGGLQDGFVVKLSPGGDHLVYSTYLGGSGNDQATAIAVDADGNAYICGATSSPDFPTRAAVQSILKGVQDPFVAKLSSSGSSLLYSTYLGGTGGTAGLLQAAYGIAVDAAGNAYVCGTTNARDFPTAGPFQAAFAGGSNDAFVTKISPAGSNLVYSTYLGGSGLDVARGVAVDSTGQAHVAGYTYSADFPAVRPLQAAAAAGDAFVAILAADGRKLAASTPLGGTGSDAALSIALGAGDVDLIAGQTQSADFPLAGTAQRWNPGGISAFLSRLVGSATAPNLVYAGRAIGAPGLTASVPVSVAVSQSFDALSFSLSAPAGATLSFEFAPSLAASSKSFSQQGGQLQVSLSGWKLPAASPVNVGSAQLLLPAGLAPGSYVLMTACSTSLAAIPSPCLGAESALRVPSSPVIDDDEFFVVQEYRNVLGRLPTSVELATARDRLERHLQTRAELVTQLILTADFFFWARSVAGVYRAALGREAEFAGWLHNLNLVQGGRFSVTSLIDGFLVSSEYLARYGRPTNSEFLVQLYRNVLERDPDPAGLASNLRMLDSGYPRAQMLWAFIGSPEYTATFRNPDLVRMLFFTQLRRNPDPTAWSQLLDRLNTGWADAAVADLIVSGTEYRARFP